MSNAIEIENLKKSFRIKGKGQSKIVEAVRGVSLSVRQGEIFGFLGPNGAGKTTCQRMLTTLLPIDDGKAVVAGYNVKKQPQKVRRHIGYVSQLGGADLSATGWENLILAGRLYGMEYSEVGKKAKELTELFDLGGDLVNRIVQTYSGGQKRRLEIALGILHEPEVLFLDEPTTGLDPQNRANLWEHIRKLRDNGMTVFLTTHYLEEADELTDRLAIMDHGKIAVQGTPKELKDQISGDAIDIRLKQEGDLSGTLLKHLSSQEFINEVKVKGESIVLYVKDGAKALPMLFEFLKTNNMELDSITLSQPSLDDVFLKQTGHSLRDTGKGESK